MPGSSHVPTHIFEGHNTDDPFSFYMEDIGGTDGNTDFDILGSSQMGGAPLYPHRTCLRRPHCQIHVQLDTQVLRIVSPTPRITFAHRTRQGGHVVVGERTPVSLYL